MKTKTYKIVLASQSPRRREILQDAGFDFIVFPSNSSELFRKNLTLEENLCSISEDKIFCILKDVSTRFNKGFLVLSADTTVVLGKKILGKPKNSTEAKKMLKLLSGKIHTVYTAFSLYNPETGEGMTRLIKTKVGFRKLGPKEIQNYVDSKEPLDKAGSYGIQGRARTFINHVQGDLVNVIGLPINDVEAELQRHGWIVKRRKYTQRTK